jgi:hypothetical protein
MDVLIWDFALFTQISTTKIPAAVVILRKLTKKKNLGKLIKNSSGNSCTSRIINLFMNN